MSENLNSENKFYTSMDSLMPLIRESLEAGKTVRFSPMGISMLPMLRQGIDTVTLSPIRGDLKKYDIPLYQRDNGAYILHRIISVGDTCVCMGDNQFAPEMGVRRDQMIAVVSSFTRGSREISVTSVIYRLYCRFWHYSRPMRHLYCRGIGWLRRKLQ